jgi:chemotaxis protein methyltransferase CheR
MAEIADMSTDRADLLARFSARLADHMGLHFPRERWRELGQGMEAASREFGYDDVASCIEWLLASRPSRRQIEVLASHLTVGETYFFRDQASFACLEKHMLAPLIRARKGRDQRLRIWSAGCCSGEEAYSVAILLGKVIPDPADWNITILATDINPGFLSKASQGVYGDWSFRETTPAFRQQQFSKIGPGLYRLPDPIRSMVTFSFLNLAEDPFPALENNTNAMDVILCRNVLMYFEPERAGRIVAGFQRALMNGGWLLVSPTEASQPLFSCLEAVNVDGRTLYRKGDPPTMTAHPPVASTEVAYPTLEDIGSRHGAGHPKQPAGNPFTRSGEHATRLYEQGSYSEAADEIGAWLQRHSGDVAAMMLLVRIHANQGRLDEALGICAQAIGVDKLNSGCYYLQATILQEQGDPGRAVEALKRALFLDPDFVLAHLALGNVERRRGRLAEAERSFDNALALLKRYRKEEVLPESEGITAGRLEEILRSRVSREAAA